MIDDCREVARRSKREVVFGELTIGQEQDLQYSDQYAPERRSFAVCGMQVPIEDDMLAHAISNLSYDHMNIILLAYILGLSDSEIAGYLGLTRSTVQYRRQQGLKKLKKIMEVYDDEAKK